LKKYLILFFLILLSGCSQFSQMTTEDFPVIKSKVATLIKEEFDKEDLKPEIQEMVPHSLKVHQIFNIEDNVYALVSYKYKVIGLRNANATNKKDLEFMKNQTYYRVWLRKVERDRSAVGYKLTGGTGGGGEIPPLSPITFTGTEKWIFGLILNPKVTKVTVLFADGKTFSQNTNGKDYYFIHRTDNIEAKIKEVKSFDSEGNPL